VPCTLHTGHGGSAPKRTRTQRNNARKAKARKERGALNKKQRELEAAKQQQQEEEDEAAQLLATLNEDE